MVIGARWDELQGALQCSRDGLSKKKTERDHDRAIRTLLEHNKQGQQLMYDASTESTK